MEKSQRKFLPSNFNLGYACLNTEVRKKGVYSSRTCRISTIEKKGVEYLKELSLKNLKDLLKILQYNKEKGIKFFRMSSEIFPFATHEKYGYSISFSKHLLKDIGDYSKEHKIRLTFHPGQFNVLNSNNPDVVENTIKDLSLHSQILEMMDLDKDSVMVIHGGGVYGDKQKSLERLKENIRKLPETLRNRLVLENCEMSYNVEELLPISEELKVPLVIDFHHDDINNSSHNVSYYYERVFRVWKERGIKVKIHVSNSVPGVKETDSKTKRRKHSDYIYYIQEELLKIEENVDLMLECKAKEQALFRLREEGF